MAEVQCGTCPRSFPEEHATVCLIGTFVCPPCELEQLRFPISILAEEADLAFGLDNFSDRGIECLQTEDCPCYSHQIERAREKGEKEISLREQERLEKIRQWAALPIYQH